jgi:hypothetical protein
MEGTLIAMQLRIARLCHDCEEVHADQQCPVCASETFTFITRWVPVPERRARPRPTTSPEADLYRQITQPDTRRRNAQWLKRAALGLTAVGVLGWLWGRKPTELASSSSRSER